MIRRRTRAEVLRDPEVLELLRDEPELLAIADTIHATLGEDYRRGRRRGRVARVGMLVAALSAAAVLALVQPWSSGGGLVAHALAAIPGTGQVVHAVLKTPLSGVEVVDLRSGRTTPEQVTAEFWFDPRRHLLHTLIRRQGVVIADVLAAPEQTVSAAGPVLGRASPSLDPALLAFASGYRQALASGHARPLGRALAGTRAQLLEVTTRLGRELVTLDPETLRPREVRALLPGGRPAPQAARVLTLATVPARAGNFVARARPAQPVASGGAVETSSPLPPGQARRALARPPLWVGKHLSGLSLRLLAQQRLSRVFAASRPAKSTHGSGIDLIYGAVHGSRPDWRSRFLEIQQATTPEPAYGFLSGPLRIEPLPQPGVLRLERQPLAGSPGHAIWRGELRQNGLYLALTGSSRDLVLAAARALRPISFPSAPSG